MNAGAGSINEAGIALVYLVNVVPSLTMKLTGPYWPHGSDLGRAGLLAIVLEEAYFVS